MAVLARAVAFVISRPLLTLLLPTAKRHVIESRTPARSPPATRHSMRLYPPSPRGGRFEAIRMRSVSAGTGRFGVVDYKRRARGLTASRSATQPAFQQSLRRVSAIA